jgi:hypothetical protein
VTDAERIQPGPFSHSLGFHLVRADEAGAQIEATPGREHVNAWPPPRPRSPRTVKSSPER